MKRILNAISGIAITGGMLVACNVTRIFPVLNERQADKCFWLILWFSFLVSLLWNMWNSQKPGYFIWFIASGLCVTMFAAEVFDQPTRVLPWHYILAALFVLYLLVELLKHDATDKNPD